MRNAGFLSCMVAESNRGCPSNAASSPCHGFLVAHLEAPEL
jgi:hypothetical protein